MLTSCWKCPSTGKVYSIYQTMNNKQVVEDTHLQCMYETDFCHNFNLIESPPYTENIQCINEPHDHGVCVCVCVDRNIFCATTQCTIKNSLSTLNNQVLLFMLEYTAAKAIVKGTLSTTYTHNNNNSNKYKYISVYCRRFMSRLILIVVWRTSSVHVNLNWNFTNKQ